MRPSLAGAARLAPTAYHQSHDRPYAAWPQIHPDQKRDRI